MIDVFITLFQVTDLIFETKKYENVIQCFHKLIIGGEAPFCVLVRSVVRVNDTS